MDQETVVPAEQIAEEKQESAIVIHAKKVNNGLELFDQKKQEFQTLAEEAKALRVDDIHDKAQLKKVKEHRLKIKRERIVIENDAKGYRDFFTTINKNISAKENELLAIISTAESDLKKEEDRVDAELEKERQDAIDAENKRIQDRIDQLAKYGVVVDYTELKLASDEDFQLTLTEAQKDWEQEQKRLADLKAAEEADRLKLQKEKEELELAKKRQEDAEKQLAEQRKQLQKQKLDLRQLQLSTAGASYSEKGSLFQLGKWSATLEEVGGYSDDDFSKLVKDITLSAKEIAAAEENKKQIEIRTKHRSNELISIGMKFSLTKGGFVYKDEADTLVKQSDIETLDDSYFTATLSESSRLIAQYIAEETEKEKTRIEKEKQDAIEAALKKQKEDAELAAAKKKEEEAQKSDGEKYQILYDRFADLVFPEMTSRKGKKVLQEVRDRVLDIYAIIRPNIPIKK
jgi:hypothetical protein